MAAAETARLIASLELQDRNFTRGIRQVEKGVDRVDRKLSAVGGFVNRNLARALDTAALKLVQVVGTGLEELATLEDASSAVTGAIQQVGKGWTITAEDIAQAANRIESETDATFDDKAIVAATETLIRYGKVTENNIEPAMEIMTDLAARTGDVDSAATLLAKSLADPAKAAGKLARQGIILTKQQQKQIKAMVEAGDVAGAQALLLETLEKTTKGAAAASAGPYRDALNKMADAGEDLRRGFVVGLAPAILEVSDLLTTELAKPSTIKALKDAGKEVGAALKGLISIAKKLPWDSIGNAMKLAGTGAKAVLDAFLGLPPWVQTAVLTGWGLNKITGGAVTDIFGKLLGKGIDIFAGRGSSPANPLFVAGSGIGGGPGGIAGGGKGRLGIGTLGGAVLGTVAVTLVGEAIALQQQISDRSTEQAQTASKSLDAMLAQKPDLETMRTSLAAVNTGINQIQANPLLTVVQGQALEELKAMRAKLEGEIEVVARPKIEARAPANAAANQASIAAREGGGKTTPEELAKIHAAVEAAQRSAQNANTIATREASALNDKMLTVKEKQQATTNAIKAAQSIASRENAAIKSETALAKNAAATAGRTTTAATNMIPPSVRSNALTVAASQAAAASSIVSAIWQARPVIQSTNVVNNYTTQQRTGNTSGSRRSGPLE